MQSITEFFRHYPELAIFLTFGAAYWIGTIKPGNFSLGTRLVGVLVGQMGISISSTVRSVFFLIFLFAFGYGGGPQFFRRSEKQQPSASLVFRDHLRAVLCDLGLRSKSPDLMPVTQRGCCPVHRPFRP